MEAQELYQLIESVTDESLKNELKQKCVEVFLDLEKEKLKLLTENL